MSKTVLIIEDDIAIRETFVEIVELEGHLAAQAENGAVALDQLRKGPRPSLILLDLMMPVKDGFQFRAEQLADPKLASIPVVILSAMGSVREIVARLGTAIPVLRKPPDLDEVIEAVRKNIE